MSNTANEGDRMMIVAKDARSSDEGSSGGCGSGSGDGLKKGPWTAAEDEMLVEYVNKHGQGSWNAVQKQTALSRCGKSCRLRWANHLRPNLKKGPITPGEEKKIIQMHASMGNKWARMAAKLPGRTDNEIKNFWNTRTKRLQRSGLPLYPSDICTQVSNENQGHSIGDLSSDDRQQSVWLRNTYAGGGFPEAHFEYLNPDRASLYVAPLMESSVNNMVLTQGLVPQNCILHDPHSRKRLRGPDGFHPGSCQRTLCQTISNDSVEKFFGTFAPNYAYVTGPIGRNPVPTGSAISGSHCPINGNYSTVNVELPSLQCLKNQYHDIDVDNWFATPSPLNMVHIAETNSMQSESSPQWNDGLLEDMLLETPKKQRTVESSSHPEMTPNGLINHLPFSTFDPEWERYGDTTSPLGCSNASIFNEATPPISGASSAEHPPSKGHTGTGIVVPSAEHVSTLNGMERDIKPSMDLLRPDALLELGWSVENLPQAKEEEEEEEEDMNNALSTLFDEFISEPDYVQAGSDIGSCTWDNMPRVCQISEHP